MARLQERVVGYDVGAFKALFTSRIGRVSSAFSYFIVVRCRREGATACCWCRFSIAFELAPEAMALVASLCSFDEALGVRNSFERAARPGCYPAPGLANGFEFMDFAMCQ